NLARMIEAHRALLQTEPTAAGVDIVECKSPVALARHPKACACRLACGLHPKMARQFDGGAGQIKLEIGLIDIEAAPRAIDGDAHSALGIVGDWIAQALKITGVEIAGDAVLRRRMRGAGQMF